MVITDGIREYVARDWAAARANKDAYWAERIARLGPREGLRIAGELRRQVIQRCPAWPDDGQRQEDRRSHTRLAELMRRASAAGPR
jgi:hypothetical protein